MTDNDFYVGYIFQGSTSRQYLIVWKYNSESSALTLKTESGIQCLCASKLILIIFVLIHSKV